MHQRCGIKSLLARIYDVRTMQRADMQQELAQLGNGAHALATRMLGNADEAADAVHDAFASVLARPGAFDPARGSLKVWFLRVVRNRCTDLLRMRRPAGPDISELLEPGAGPEQLAEQGQRERQLRDAMAALPTAQQEIIVLRDYLDLGYAEIAQVLDIAAGTVMSRLHRARLALKHELDRRGRGYAPAGNIPRVPKS
jgi:RNA polymerase sigma-70 factor (ECF subfamily)